jgi:preprotein translocase subunit YajC
MIVALGAVFYFFLLRPQQKKAKEQQARLASIDVGTRVMLTSGIYGTIRHMGEKQVIIEVGPGVEITVVRQAIMQIINPTDEEFEYTDDAEEQADDTAAPVIKTPTNEEIEAFFSEHAEQSENTPDTPDKPDEPGSPSSNK